MKSEWDKLWHLPENREFDVGPSWRSKLRQLHRLVDPIGVTGSVLDAACGMGRLLKEWSGSADSLTGVDASAEALRAAEDYFPQAKYQQLNIEKAKLTEKFDWVFCTNALEEMEADEAALKHMAEMVAPGGHLSLIVPHRKAYWTSKDKMAGNKRRYEREELTAKVKAAGLEIVRTRTWGWPMYRVWYRLMERVDQRKVWDKKATSKFGRLAAHVAYAGLMVDDLFSNSPYGSVLLLLARKRK